MLIKIQKDNGDKLIIGVNDNGGKFIDGVNNTGGKFIPSVKNNGDKHDADMILKHLKHASKTKAN